MHVPGLTGTGAKCERIVELVDLYPTLCDVAGLPIPEDMEGTSFKPLLEDANRPWKSAAFSQFHRAPRITPDGGRYMGLSMVTDQYHYVEWRTWNHVTGVAGDLAAVELYDQRSDPQENTNIAGLTEFQPIVERLSNQLHRGWRSAVPNDQR